MWSRKKRYSILLCIVTLLLTSCSVFTRKESLTNTSDNLTYNYPVVLKDEEENVQIKVTYGLNHYAKIGKEMHVNIEVHTQEKPFEGYLQIEVPYDNTSTKYNQKVSVDSNSHIEYETQIPVVYENMKFLVHLLDKEQDIQVSQIADVEASRIYDVQYIGILDENMQTETVVSKGKMQVFQLYSDELADPFDNLNLIDCIFLNEEEIKHLEESVVSKLDNWLQNGGTLLIEEPVDYKDSTGDYGFGRYITVPKMKNISKLTEYVEELGINPKLFLSGPTDDLVKTSINAEVVSKTPDMSKYIIVFLLYIIVIGPVLYGILKRKNRRVWYLGIVPVISAVFLVIVYGLGKSTRVEDAYLRYVKVTQIAQDGYTNEATYFAVVNPTKTTVTVQADNSKNLQPLFTQSDYYQLSTDNNRSNMEFSMNVESSTDEENITNKSSTRAFQPLYLKIDNSYLPEDIEVKQSSELLTCANYRILGIFTNNTGMDLSNACIVSNQMLIYIGDLLDGESIELKDCQYEYIPSYDLLYTNGLDSRIKNLTKVINNRFEYDEIQSNVKYDLIQYVMSEWLITNPEGSYLMAFTEESNGDSILDNSDISQVELSSHLIVKDLPVDYNIGNGDVFQPSIKQYMSVVSGDYYQEMDIMESDSLIVDYDFGNEDIKQIEYSKYYNTEFYVDDTNINDLWMGFYGTAYFYNRRTGEYDKVITSGEETRMDHLEDYLGDSNVLRVRYEVSQNSANSNSITIPKLTAIKKGN
ncbi:hypothetical protein [Anaerosporobacter sp.]